MTMFGTDDELYRVDAVWLGPPGMAFPWRARYVAYGIFCSLVLPVFGLARLWFPLGVFTVAWSLVITVGLTKAAMKLISTERPAGSVLAMLFAEIGTPRRSDRVTGGAASTADLRVRATVPGLPTPTPVSAPAPIAREVPSAQPHTARI